MGRKPTKHSPPPKKRSFFKVLLGDFSKRLRIPPKFTKNHIPTSLGKCGLRDPSGKSWNVELERTSENGLFFHNAGWQTFVRDHLLQVGDFLVFHYDGVSNFEVALYDRTCCEKDVEVPKRRRGRPSKNEGNTAQVVNLDAEAEKKTSMDGRRSRNYVMPGNEIRIEGQNQTSKGSILFKSENSCLKLTLTKSQLYVVAVPKEAATDECLRNKKTVEIQDPTGKSWPIKLLTITSKQQNRYSYDRLDISKGWRECCKANKISVGDTVILEFVKQGVMRLHIFRKGPGRK